MNEAVIDSKIIHLTRKPFLSSSQATLLMLLALASMAIDHTGYALFGWSHWLHLPGRLAFPLFCFLVAYNLSFNTHSKTRYLVRIFLAFLISQPFFYLLFDAQGDVFLSSPSTWHAALLSYVKHPNIMLTLLSGGMLTVLYDRYRESGDLTQRLTWFVAGGATLLPFINPRWDYMLFGPLLILLLYAFLKNRWLPLLLPILLTAYALNMPYAYYVDSYQLNTGISSFWLCWAGVTGLVVVIPFIFTLKHLTVHRLPRYLAYGFYPAHMGFLSLVSPHKHLIF